jgi:hypothetical protein
MTNAAERVPVIRIEGLVKRFGELTAIDGVVVAAYARSVATASSLGNVAAFPMMFFSGTFFPTESLPGFLPEFTKVLPLTPLLEVLREGVGGRRRAVEPAPGPEHAGGLARRLVGGRHAPVQVPLNLGRLHRVLGPGPCPST